MEWQVISCGSTFHRTWGKDWKGWRCAGKDRAAAGCLDQRARLATYRRKKFPRALARDEWIQRRLKMLSRIRSAAANRNAVAAFPPRTKSAQPRCGWDSTNLITQGSRNGNPA